MNDQKPIINFEASNQKAMFFLRYRWIGVPILCSGIMLFLSVLTMFPQTNGDYFLILLGFGCMALGLTSFGVSHDTAMALVAEHYPKTANFNSALQREFSEDIKWDKAKTLSLSAHTKTAMVIPLLALLVQSYVFIRLSCHVDSSFVNQCGWSIF
ncbi:MAG: hypothetical protein CL916_08025 [Deltaproteobacteria bacterium]|nr:hypothetical protein [Deltaproteobacteria bacterium]